MTITKGKNVKVLALLHRKQERFQSDLSSSLLGHLMVEWHKMGIDCTTQIGTGHYPFADIVISHIDLTIVPRRYRRFLDKYPLVLNAKATDISKKRISRNLVTRESQHAGPVIVKTNSNAGGLLEQQDSYASRISRIKYYGLRHLISAKRRALQGKQKTLRHIERLDKGKYLVYKSIQKVPGEVFANKQLVVEKFIAERSGDNYLLRCYYFLGDRDINIVFHSREKIVKAANSFSVNEAPIPDEIRGIRHQLGFDYGRFDYVLHEGRVILLDANRTPGCKDLLRIADATLIQHMFRYLAGGIKFYYARRDEETPNAIRMPTNSRLDV